MKHEFGEEHVERLVEVAGRKLGLYFEDSKRGFLAQTLTQRLDATKLPAEVYLAELEEIVDSGGELAVLAEELTVSETFFFRNLDQFSALREFILPERIRARAKERSLSILSAGCASGEEPYSVAILIRESFPQLSDWRIDIQGIDLNSSSIKRARRALYSPWSLRETPLDICRKWFRPEGREFALADEIREMVDFKRLNLADAESCSWPIEAFDLVLCRNVMMYFLPQRARDLVAGIARALVPDGYLLLGHAETLRGLSHDFHLCHTHGTFYYQRKDVGEPVVDGSSPTRPTSVPRGESQPALPGDAFWVDAIQQASLRIENLAKHREAPSGVATSGARGFRRTANLVQALEFLRDEKFAEALACVEEGVSEEPLDKETLLLRAVLLVHGGNLDKAEEACRSLLAVDDLNAGAHYIMALCREARRDDRGAEEHDQIAGYLDASFAMPRLHLGLLARRRGDRAEARKEFETALALLEREEPSRILLFGGGFSREALTDMCRAELAGVGAKR